MSEMVERVARVFGRAVCAGAKPPCYKPADGCDCWNFAREAIEAMREPTPTMCQARGDMSDEDWLRVMPQDVWKSMIDEALR